MQYDIPKLRDAFVAQLRAALTPEQFAEMKRRNASPDYSGGACASHDFIDSADCMVRAFVACGYPEPGMAEIDLSAWNAWDAAWNAAHVHKLISD